MMCGLNCHIQGRNGLTTRSSGQSTAARRFVRLTPTLGAMKTAVALVILGAIIVGSSAFMPAYTDEAAYQREYMSLSPGQNEEYWALRDKMLTQKYKLQDYGGTVIVLGLTALLFVREKRIKVVAPKSRAVLVGIAVAAPFVSVAAFVFDLFQGAGRGEFPHWADSLGIPLMGAPFLFVSLAVWAAAHVGFLRGSYTPSAPLSVAVLRKANLWLLFISAITALIVADCLFEGTYWYAIPGAMWLYLYTSMAAVRVGSTQPVAPGDAPKARA